MYTLMNGKEVANVINNSLRDEVTQMRANGQGAHLSVIQVGDNPASSVYVRNKMKACDSIGIEFGLVKLPEDVGEHEVLQIINELNNDKSVNGIIVQLPLPKHLNETTICQSVAEKKDVDCFTWKNVGKLWTGCNSFVPCTPAGVMSLLDYYHIPIEGMHVVIVGRSNIVGKPMAALMLEKNATVTICHSKTKDLYNITRTADILIVAVGKPKFITWGMVKDGAVVVDVGINRDENGKLCGDVDFAGVSDRASYITPVPGGCGPMTISMLMRNTVVAAKNMAVER